MKEYKILNNADYGGLDDCIGKTVFGFPYSDNLIEIPFTELVRVGAKDFTDILFSYTFYKDIEVEEIIK